MKKATKSEKHAAIKRRIAAYATIPVRTNGLLNWLDATFEQCEACDVLLTRLTFPRYAHGNLKTG